MSAPETHIEAQKTHHIWPLLGIGLAVVAAAIAAIWWAVADNNRAEVYDAQTSAPLIETGPAVPAQPATN
ncbi:MAG: hypothetical protein ABI459_02940 [Deltaproteobacteria bacterium]